MITKHINRKIQILEKISFINGFKVGIVINVFVELWIFDHQSYTKYWRPG